VNQIICSRTSNDIRKACWEIDSRKLFSGNFLAQNLYVELLHDFASMVYMERTVPKSSPEQLQDLAKLILDTQQPFTNSRWEYIKEVYAMKDTDPEGAHKKLKEFYGVV